MFFETVGNILERYGSMFLDGTLVTLYISLLGTIIGLLIGLLIGIVRTIPLSTSGEKNITPRFVLLKIVNFILSAYIEIFRGTPMIVQATVIYFGLAEVAGIDLEPIPAGVFVISINTGAYLAEVVRGGIQSVDISQFEGAKALGLSHWQAMLKVILPQTMRNIMPALGNEFIINIKDSAVLNVISVTELFFVTKTVKGVIYKTYEPFLIAALIYLILTFTVSRILRLIEKKMAGKANFVLTSSNLSADDLMFMEGKEV
ncbi:MAG: amino acid ABC transporter permease [Bifidobacteriaceae bacterium]|jgi:putative lysine transport system permease protein|nr:amino acid ABC transporter permease [Bifidobacteriaceae bacterium]